MYAIVETGGHQFRAETGSVLSVPKMSADVGDTVVLEPVLLYSEGTDVRIGRPTLDGVTVRAEVVSHGREPKIHVLKLRKRKNSRSFQGHRQDFTRIRVTEISAG